MKLYQFPLSPNCQKVVALALEVGVPIETVFVDLFKGQSRTPEFLARNPNGKVPVLEDGDFVLCESNAMLGYIAAKADRTDLAPAAPRERAKVDQWLAWHNAHLAPAIGKVAFQRVVKKLGGLGAPDEAVVQAGIREWGDMASVLDISLSTKQYLCDRLTIADFAVASYVALVDVCGLDVSKYPNVKSWLERMIARESFKKSLASARELAVR